MRRARTTAAALLTASLVLTGCGAGGADTAAGDAKSGVRAVEPADGSRQEGAGDTASGASGASAAPGAQRAPASRTPAAPQHVIRTAALTVEVADVPKALAEARRVTAGAGGRVENETTERVDDAYVTSRVVLRVPQERYDTVLAALAGSGKLLARTADAKDVTEQVVDVESRIATQRASVARVRALMQRAEKLADVVTLEGELSRRQADLESLLAQQASLRDRTTLSTITLELVEKERPHADEDPADDRPSAGDALGGGWDALVAAGAWVVIVLAALAPWLAVALLAYAVWHFLLRPRHRARRAARSELPAREAE